MAWKEMVVAGFEVLFRGGTEENLHASQ
jgi:hypothetical protein